MKKSTKLWLIAGGILCLLFPVSLILDAIKMAAGNSAPWWAFVAARAIEFLLPGILFLIIGAVLFVRQRKQK